MAEAQMMEFPKTVDEFMEFYKIVDTEQVYTNGSELVPIFRMRQWFDHLNVADWISVKERLPKNYQKVLVFWEENSEPMIDTAFWQPDARRFDGHHWVRMVDKVSHWMPLPEPPREVEDA